ncbi:LuxR C-terminal-related transcriptional regulator [Longispora sp. NPDC051575]|uniref:helix-turn-helix transcriptional regulator n=1 Tax=Longispora sp. NPDC051575 TaxID=3154943 RepID=UPI003437B705
MWQDVLVEVGCVAGGTADPAQAASEALRVIHRIVPFAAASLSRYDPLTGEHRTLANDGYPDDVLRYLDTTFVDDDIGYRTMRGSSTTPLRWRDVPGEVPYRETRSALETFLPNGFVEGVTVCLYTRAGRYTGSLHLSTDSTAHPADDVVPALVVLQTMLSGVADGMRAATDPLTLLGPGDRAAVVSREGRAVAVPGCDLGPQLARGDGLVADVARHLAGGHVPPRFWWPDPDGGWHQVRMYPVAGGAVVVETPARLPYELTARELDVLNLMVAGYSNPQIAGALTVAPKTAAKHVEHVLAKLGCGSRTEAAVLAIREGLIRLPDETIPRLRAVA